MSLISRRNSLVVDRIELRLPVIVMVLAATAIPIELQLPIYEPTGFSISANLITDVLLNVLGYVPVGIVLWDRGPLHAVTTAAAIAASAETAQLVMVHRDPSILDVLANTVGAGLGAAIAFHWKVPIPAFHTSPRGSGLAALMAATIIAALWMTSAGPPSARGAILPGRLEAHWKLDEHSGRIATDSSGQGLDGKFSLEPNRAGRAVLFDGARDYADFGSPPALRLIGSMTVSAWIKSTSYPIDDAAIVSSLDSAVAGYQLDTTVDRGPRTIAFKIANDCGRLAARYGATPLLANTWYHAAGVYNSEARTLDVYLNGVLDNGFLFGSMTGALHSSRSPVYIGRRSDGAGYEFAGSIHNVRIYSRALTAAEIASDIGMDGLTPERRKVDKRQNKTTKPPITTDHQRAKGGLLRAPCAISSDRQDKHIPMAAAAVGVLAAFAAVGLWPNGGNFIWLIVSLAAGVLLPSSTLPAINLWLLPLTSLAGGASVLVSRRRPP